MNKKLIICILILLVGVIIVLSFVKLAINKAVDKVTFNATVLENQGTSLLVEPFESESELNSSDKIVVRVPEEGATLKDLSEFEEGSKVKITYDGTIMESYPAQINAYNVELIK